MSVGGDLLFHGVIKEVSNEGAVSRWIVCDIGDNVTRSREPHRFSFIGGEVAHRVDGLVIVLGSPATNGIKIFEAEAERVDHRVARHARVVSGEFRDLLPHGECWIKMTFIESDGHRRRFECHAHDVTSEEDAAVDR